MNLSANRRVPEQSRIHEVGLGCLSERGEDLAAMSAFPSLMQQLEKVSLQAVLALFASSGALSPNGVARTADEILDTLQAAPQHAWIVRRWLALLVEEGELDQFGEAYQWLGGVPDNEQIASLPERYAALGFPAAMAKIHQAVLAQLPRLVRDEVSIRQVLFQDGQITASLAAYQDNVFTAYLNTASAALLNQYPKKQGEPLRIIELGGGAGLSTAVILQALQNRRIDYLFTDVSRLFTVAAKQRFNDCAGLRCALLDINVDFSEQGVSPCHADIIFAGNALHNAINIKKTLEYIYHALTPGGWLVFTESVRDNAAVLTSMQFLLSPVPGVPQAGSGDLRAGTDQIFLNGFDWNAALIDAGFFPQCSLPSSESPLSVAGQQLFFAIAS